MYEFTKLQLTRDEFNNLVFMGPPSSWKKDRHKHEFLLSLSYKNLKHVAQKVKEESGVEGQNPNPTEVFKNIDIIPTGDETPWFKRHACLSQHFHKSVMGKIWIRNLTNYDGGERDCCPQGTFYIEDGNHRALVYAVHIECGSATYDPVEAIHATSWNLATGILGHQVQSAHVLENHGKLQDKNRRFEGQFHMDIDRYERP